MKYQLPIVGMAFRPPANMVINQIPYGKRLILRRQPDNPHDSNAIMVFLPGFCTEEDLKSIAEDMKNLAIPEGAELARGQFHASSIQDTLFLGYVGAKTGHAAEFAALMDSFGIEACYAYYSFLMTGAGCAEAETAPFETID